MIRCAFLLAVIACCLGAGQISREHPVVRVGGTPYAFVAGHGSLWVLTCKEGCTEQGRSAIGRIVRIDPRKARIVASNRFLRPDTAAVTANGVYVLDFWRDRVRLVDPHALRVVRTLKLRLPFVFSPRDNAFLPEAVAVSRHAVWVATDRGALARTDLRLRRIISTTRLPAEAFGDPVGGMAVGEGAVWLAESLAGVYRVDPGSARISARISVPLPSGRFDATEVIPCGGELLVLGARTSGGVLTPRNELARIDVPRNRVEAVTTLPAGPLELACGSRSLWLAHPSSSVVERLDPSSGKVVERRHARIGTALAFAGGHLWTAFEDGTVRQL